MFSLKAAELQGKSNLKRTNLVFCSISLSLLLLVRNSHLEAVVRPAAELHDTGLLVEGEILDVHLTGAVVDGGGFPLHQTIVKQSGLGGQRHLKVSVSAEHFNISRLSMSVSHLTGKKANIVEQTGDSAEEQILQTKGVYTHLL